MVLVDMKSVISAWHSMGQSEVNLEFQTGDCTYDQWESALIATNEELHEAPVFGGLPTPSPSGFLTAVDDSHDLDQLVTWLARLADELAAAGVTGTIRGVVPPPLPQWLWMGHMYPNELTGFIAWTVDLDAMAADPERRSHWGVEPEYTRRISNQLAGWTAPGGPTLHISRSVFRAEYEPDADIEAVLGAAILEADQASIERIDPATESGRTAHSSPGGETVIQIVGTQAPWQERVSALTEPIVALADLAASAFIRRSSRSARSWQDLGFKWPLPGPSAAKIIRAKHLAHRFVPDAHGVQVLTDHHLENARDLSTWNITDLGNHRLLVQAADLAPWYESAVPHPEVLHQARLDFGAMIITEATLAVYPPPW